MKYVKIRSEKDIFTKLPQDLTKLTQRQHQDIIKYLSKLSLKELRKRQDLNNKQLEKAFKTKNSSALSNLRVKERHYNQAVDRKF